MQAGDTPEKRSDLVLTPVTEEGQTRTVVHDPRSGRYFRIREVEGFILSLLDGATPLAQVHEAVLREFPGVRLSLPTVLQFGDRLAQLGWLVGTEPGARRAAPLFRRLRRMQLPPIPADALFGGLQPLLRLAYHPAVLVLIALIVLAAGYWAFFSLDELAGYPVRLTTPGGLAVLYVGITLIGALHEIGHGATCHYFGARSRGIGFFLVYGIPCFYCDVSGAWTLSSRRERMLIGWAGLGWQLFFGAMAFVLWKALEPNTLAARICHVMVGTCGVTALLNLNPFIKLDGYYLLSDWWRIPNLREKAITYFRGRAASFFLGAPPPRVGQPGERRVLFWFGTASFFYTVFLVGLIAYGMSRRLLGTLHGTGALILGVFLMAALSSWLKTALSRARAPRSGAGPEGEQGGPKGEGQKRLPVLPKPRMLLTLAVIMGALYWFWNAKWTFFVASPCTLEAEQRVAVRPQVEGSLQEIRYGEGDRVRAGATIGVIETYDLQKNTEQLQQRVQSVQAAGDVIEQQAPLVEAEKDREVIQAEQGVRDASNDLDEREKLYPIRRSEAEKRVREARAAWDAAEQIADRTRQDERAVAEGNLTPAMQAVAERIERTRGQRALAQKEVQRATYLVNEGALQRQKLDLAATELQSLDREEASLRSELGAMRKALVEKREDAEAEVRRLRAVYDTALEAQRLVEEETRPEKLEDAREELATRQAVLESNRLLRRAADVKRAEASAKRLEARPIVTEIERIQKKIRQSRVVAPVSGVISTPRLEEKAGRHYDKGETIAWIDRLETLTAHVFVDEKEIGDVRKGAKVQLRVGAFPDRSFEGRVMELAPRASKGNAPAGRGTYEVRLRIQNPRGDLRPGITGYAKILGGERPLREVVFHRLHRYVRTEVWTWF